MRFAYVIGTPIAHSISPAIHNAAFAALGIDAQYARAEVQPEELSAWVLGVRRAETLGFNVTLPHKEAIFPHLDRVEGDATLTGAVNCVIVKTSPDFRETELVGTNTDTLGFRRSLTEEVGTTLAGQRVLLLGAGGAARAVALVALQDRASDLWVANRHVERAKHLLEEFREISGATRIESTELSGKHLQALVRAASVVVNATSVGLRPQELPIDPSGIRPESLVVDLIYSPRETAFLEAARGRGARVLGGLGMLVHQAAAAFSRWTGMEAPLGVMREAAEAALDLQAHS